MIPKVKPIVLRFPWWFGYDGFTVYPFVFDVDLSASGLAHEKAHLEQQEWWWRWLLGPVGVLLWIIVYFLAFPIVWNPLRWRAEVQAYMKGNKWARRYAENYVKRYYWLWGHG